MRSRTLGSMPKSASPVSASPLSFRRMRLYFLSSFGMSTFLWISLLQASSSRDFRSEIHFFFLDAFAHFVTHEAHHVRTCFLQQRTYCGFRVFHERLLRQADLCHELAQT